MSIVPPPPVTSKSIVCPIESPSPLCEVVIATPSSLLALLVDNELELSKTTVSAVEAPLIVLSIILLSPSTVKLTTELSLPEVSPISNV